MKKGNPILKILIIAVVLVLLLNPSLIPFFSEGTKAAVQAELAANIGLFAGEGAAGVFSVSKVITAVSIILLVWLVCSVICFVMEKVSAGKKRSRTVAGLLDSVVKSISAIIAIVWVLSVMGVNLAGIFASLGIVSLIVGFGAQSLIEDSITGIFIILEGVYNVGDIIILDDFRGTVEKVSMRTTTIKDAGGNLKIINNSDIRNVQNRSNNPSYAICDVGTSYDADIRDIEKVIFAALPDMYERNKDIFLAQPEYVGVEALADSSVVVRVRALIKEENYFVANRRLNREMKILFDENNVEIPFNQLVVHNAK